MIEQIMAFDGEGSIHDNSDVVTVEKEVSLEVSVEGACPWFVQVFLVRTRLGITNTRTIL